MKGGEALLDPNFNPAESRLQDIFDHLQSGGFEVYFPAQKVGECLKPYCVVRLNPLTQVPGTSTDLQTYSVICYVPRLNYGQLEGFIRKVKARMKALYPMIVSERTQTQSFYDDQLKGHMVDVGYRNAQKFNHQLEFD